MERMMAEMEPLVSCIMPTRNRRAFVARALHYFERQDYARKELIVVDDGDDLVVDLVSRYPWARYLAPQYVHSVGGKRNIACEAARGEIICHWDDDDWYAPTRLSYQMAPLLAGEADLSGLHLESVLDIERMQGWQCHDASAPHPGVEGMHHGTLLYWRHLWTKRARFQDISQGEDTGFVRRLLDLGARVYTLPCAGQHVYIRHNSNGWRYQPGTPIGNEVWSPIDPRQCMPLPEAAFYKSMSDQSRRCTNSLAAIKKRLATLLPQ